jgi:hypothetical protein
MPPLRHSSRAVGNVLQTPAVMDINGRMAYAPYIYTVQHSPENARSCRRDHEVSLEY